MSKIYEWWEHVAALAEKRTPFNQAVPTNELESNNYKLLGAAKPKFGKIEKLAIGLVLFVWLMSMFLTLTSQVKLSNRHHTLQNVQSEAALTELNNRNLEQEIQELSRYDRIIAVATELGLELNEANIKSVSR